MKSATSSALSLLFLSPLSHGGETPQLPPVTDTPDFMSLVKITGDIRGRYEFRETDPLDASHALTVRARLGLLLGDDSQGFSAFIEGEGTQGLIEDFQSSGNSQPQTPGNTVIADPNNAEINQLYAQYKNDHFLARLGLQRMIRNSGAFIGNVGWRQNEQTFDAALIAYTREGFHFSYAYFNRVQRIFGKDAGGSFSTFEGEGHLIDFNYDASFGKTGGYAYLLDIDNNANVGESNTFGAFLDTHNLHAEFAYQDGESDLAGGHYNALYGHLKYTTKAGGATLSAGVEYLGENFKTPLATVHLFNGFADAFIGQRIGLNDNGGDYNGLTDIYLGYVRSDLPYDLTFKGYLHYFADGELSNTYGYEADAAFLKTFSKDLTGILKFSYFAGEDFYDDIKQVSFDLNYTF